MNGKILVIGGAEDKENNSNRFTDLTILERFVKEARHGKRSRIEIIPSASSVPEEMGKEYIKIFRKMGAENCGVLMIETRQDPEKPQYLKRLQQADAIFVTGGSQLALTSLIGGIDFYSLLLEKLDTRGFMYTGTSAALPQLRKV